MEAFPSDPLALIANYLPLSDTLALSSTCQHIRQIMPLMIPCNIQLKLNRLRLDLTRASNFITQLLQHRVKLDIELDTNTTLKELQTLHISRFHSVRFSHFPSKDCYILPVSILEELSTVHTLDCMFRWVQDASMLGNVKHLTLKNFKLTADHKVPHGVTDVSALSNVQILNLSGCVDITDVSMLGNAHTLILDNCKKIVDVSKLNLVHTLDISHTMVSDVSNLGNVYDLNLHGCKRVSDVSALGRVHILNLSECDAITDVSMLGGVYELNLGNCDGVMDVQMLGTVHTLDLNNCKMITNVSTLGNIHTLCLEGCYNIAAIPINCCNDTLDISECYRIFDLTEIKKVNHLIFRGCNLMDVVGWTSLVNLQTLDLNDSFDRFSPEQYDEIMAIIAKIPNVYLRYCNVHDVSAFATGVTHTLDISRTFVSDVSMLGRLKRLDIQHTDVTDVFALKNVEILKMTGCNVADVSMLTNVRKLTVSPSVDVSMLSCEIHRVVY